MVLITSITIRDGRVFTAKVEKRSEPARFEAVL